MSNELILHHYATSPFSEKIRLILGFKGVAWRSVTVPPIMPKPDVIALTGGYRKTPFLQIGADIYCDTALMARVIEAHYPEPSLYPAEISGMAQMLAQWADSTLFWTAIPYTAQPAGLAALFANARPEALKAFAADRAPFTSSMVRQTPADATMALHTYLGWLEMHMADERDFLAGGQASIADFSTAHCLWYVHRAPELARIFGGYPKLRAWFERVRAFGRGESTPMTSADAIDVAAKAKQHAPTEVQAGLGFSRGDAITVMPTDYGRDPVAGTLVGLTNIEVVIEHRDERAGTLHVHFPRLGFQIRKQEQAT
ncbi:glutathione S-transferase family protein [Cupriavidus sp. L7L]|uniref:glutathione S-transferase family protein n=1 Tax=Cupriavidus sp. L7L TaxID=2546443 RepID=UPI001054355F|nr:glutathione S-transferase family protein [Cupriavidus sp. L7L]TDF64524.1 glutathione S-transferase family protein [Cupriavidus sp. L7L]